MKPEGAKIIRNGRAIPLDLVFRGVNDEGIEVWSSLEQFNPFTDKVQVDILPPFTSIQFGDDDTLVDPTPFFFEFAFEMARAEHKLWMRLAWVCTGFYFLMMLVPWVLPDWLWVYVWVVGMISNTAFYIYAHIRCRRALRAMDRALEL